MTRASHIHPGPPPAGPRPPDGFFHAIEIIADSRQQPSTRIYRVAPSLQNDHPLLRSGEATADKCITIHRFDGEKMILSNTWPWTDTDAWAGWRWRKAEQDFRDMSRGGRP